MSTVKVGCKLPNGIVLHLHVVDGKGKEARNRIVAESEVRLNGFATKHAVQAAHRIIGGYGMTEVDASFWAEWKKLNATFPPLMNGLIFAEEDDKVADLEALDRSSLRSGFEPLDRNKPGKGLEPLAAAS